MERAAAWGLVDQRGVIVLGQLVMFAPASSMSLQGAFCGVVPPASLLLHIRCLKATFLWTPLRFRTRCNKRYFDVTLHGQSGILSVFDVEIHLRG